MGSFKVACLALSWIGLPLICTSKASYTLPTDLRNCCVPCIGTMSFTLDGTRSVMKIVPPSVQTNWLGKGSWHWRAILWMLLAWSCHGPLARYVKLRVAHAPGMPGMPGTFSLPPQVSDPDMHHGTCVTHVPWCMPGSLTSGFLWSRRLQKTFPAFPAHAQHTILRIWQEAHDSFFPSNAGAEISLVEYQHLHIWWYPFNPDALGISIVNTCLDCIMAVAIITVNYCLRTEVCVWLTTGQREHVLHFIWIGSDLHSYAFNTYSVVCKLQLNH